MFSTFRKTFVWWSLVPPLFGAVFLTGAVNDYLDAVELRDHGIATLATIEEKETEKRLVGDAHKTFYLVTHTYVGPQQERYRNTLEVGSDTYRDLHIGETYEVFYAPEDHREQSFSRSGGMSGAVLNLVICSLIVLAGSVWVGISGHRSLRAAMAVRNGWRRHATVTRLVKSDVEINDEPRFRLEWSIEAPRGRRVIGRSFLHSEVDLADWKRGDRIGVYVDDPDRPRRSWWARDLKAN